MQQLVMACHITGVYDVNRRQQLAHDDFSLVKDWVASISGLNVRAVLFHNGLSDSTCAAHQNEYVQFVRIQYDARLNPNVFRYFVYRDWLRTHVSEIDSLFVTDVSDVVMSRNPFVEPLFLNNPDGLFCGDEPTTLHNDWMKAHGTHLREQLADYADFEARFADATLLNCGIMGGSVSVMQLFLEQLCTLHERYNQNNTTAYTGDMGAFNYLARTRFGNHLWHGEPINTVFKAYQTHRTDCWFRHK